MNGRPTGAFLAQSDAKTQADMVANSWRLVSFHFSTPYILDPHKSYAIVVEMTGYATGLVLVGTDITAPTHEGNYCYNIDGSGWTGVAGTDAIFYIIENNVLDDERLFEDILTAIGAGGGVLVAILAQLDVALSTRASEATIAAILAQLDVALSSRASEATVAAILAQLDVALSTIASEATLTAVGVVLTAILAKMDDPADPMTNDVLDRAARLLGIIYGDVGQLHQNAARSAYTIEESPTSVIEGQVTLSGGADNLPNEPCKSITLENPSGNAVVCVGHDNTVTLANGYRLQPGATYSMDIDNANRVWVIGTVAQVISYGGVN